MSFVNWSGPDSLCLLDPRTPHADQIRLRAASGAVAWPAHVWLATSGSSALPGTLPSLLGLSKHAFLVSAAAVNRHLEVVPGDRWLAPLPTFHVGGLAISARAALSGSEVIPYWRSDRRWSPQAYHGALVDAGATLSAVVPTQLHDLVLHSLPCPPSLRCLLVGGAALSSELWEAAQSLGWPVSPTYGMTECCSQVATALLGASSDSGGLPPLQLLSHIDARVVDGQLQVRSEALASGRVRIQEDGYTVEDLLVGGWYLTGDKGAIEGDTLSIHGRAMDWIKVGGEGVDLVPLRRRLAGLVSQAGLPGEHLLVAVPDARLGHVLATASSGCSAEQAESLLQAFNKGVLPYAVVRKAALLPSIPRSALGKPLWGLLAGLVADKG